MNMLEKEGEQKNGHACDHKGQKEQEKLETKKF